MSNKTTKQIQVGDQVRELEYLSGPLAIAVVLDGKPFGRINKAGAAGYVISVQGMNPALKSKGLSHKKLADAKKALEAFIASGEELAPQDNRPILQRMRGTPND